MRRIGAIAVLLSVAVGLSAARGVGADDSHTYRIEMLNAFGIVNDSDVRVAGVSVGSVSGLEVNEAKRAVATVELTGPLGVLGDATTCSTEPQSLIAEYFIDCQPKGEPLAEGGTIPARRVRQSVQLDLVATAMREPYRERLRLLINEFGTALAGNGENLNGAIRASVPALTELRRVTGILARQHRALRSLNVNAEQVITRLAQRRRDVATTIVEARDTAATAAARRDDLSRDADLLDDFSGELQPLLAKLGETSRAGLPLLSSLDRAAPGLTELATLMPPFSRASGRAIAALGDAAPPARIALRRGRDELRALRRAGRSAAPTGEVVADLLRDLDDPRRIVEIDARAARACDDPNRSCYATGREAPTGYTGLEGLLNYFYYQAGVTNQFDSVGHLLQFNLNTGGPFLACGSWNARPDAPAAAGGRTTDILETDPCVAWMGKTQPGITADLNLPRYDDSVCPHGSTDLSLCDPNVSSDSAPSRAASSPASRPRADRERRGPAPGAGRGPESRVEEALNEVLEQARPRTTPPSPDRIEGSSVRDLLDFLFKP